MTPFLGVVFGGATSESPLTYGGSVAWLGKGIIGFEGDFGFSRNVFEMDNADFDVVEGSNLTTLMGNVIVGIPFGRTDGPSRLYGTGGLGLVRSCLDDIDDFFDIDENAFGFNVGGGVMGFFSGHVGLRGDIRYFRSLQEQDVETQRIGARLLASDSRCDIQVPISPSRARPPRFATAIYRPSRTEPDLDDLFWCERRAQTDSRSTAQYTPTHAISAEAGRTIRRRYHGR